MEILDGGEPFLHWDRNLSELSEGGENDGVLYSTHFTELLDDLSQDALLGQLLSDPFLSDRGEAMDIEEELTPTSPVPPHIQAEHSYSLSGDSRPQSPLSHLPGEPGSDAGDSEGDDWPMETEDKSLKMEPLLCDLPTLTVTITGQAVTSDPVAKATTSKATATLTLANPQSTELKIKVKDDGETFTPQIKLEPHEVDQFLNLSPKALESLQMPPTPPSSHGSDSEGSQSPVHPCAPSSPTQTPAALKVAPRAPSSLSNSPLLTAPHKLQGSGPLMLTEEERRTLIAEGYPVPNKLPLTKAEEKALKKIRRKIKNKISAQESRRKKKEYMDALEKKVETCSNENSELRRKVENLECTNKSLLQQLHSLQVAVAGKVPRSCRVAAGTQTSTCLMVVVLCFAVFLGSFYQGLSPCSSLTKTGLSREPSMQESYTATVKSRSLLSYEDHGGMEEHPAGLGGEYPEWDAQMEVMATWRLEQQHHHEEQLEALKHTEEAHASFSHSNDTHNSQKTAVLIDLNPHRSLEQRSNESTKVIELERTVNETS
ncbi:cyclic AMP-responsive element-binding protein 3-like protein 2 [Clupea harengus]|uniref:Cyclic AMP-responsive element-binding protein 3-like protein 2 n=1 Tax=Clupea harengus TaxID=7950 RepID=A0A6P3VZN4_CLUHA|nr:cyclic AMP-responsive element-binding protein 3-like protein 2 [Clupea harengus]